MTKEPSDEGAVTRIGLRVISDEVVDLHPHQFEGHVLRTTDPNGPLGLLFVVTDFAGIIGASPSKAVTPLDDDEKGLVFCLTPGGPQRLVVVTESGFFALVFRSHGAVRPGTSQHRFRRWVTSDVLPSIRKTGGYQTDGRCLDQGRLDQGTSPLAPSGTADRLALQILDASCEARKQVLVLRDEVKDLEGVRQGLDGIRRSLAHDRETERLRDALSQRDRAHELELDALAAGYAAIPDGHVFVVVAMWATVAIVFNRLKFDGFYEEELQALAAHKQRTTGALLVVWMPGVSKECRRSWEEWSRSSPLLMVAPETPHPGSRDSRWRPQPRGVPLHAPLGFEAFKDGRAAVAEVVEVVVDEGRA